VKRGRTDYGGPAAAAAPKGEVILWCKIGMSLTGYMPLVASGKYTALVRL